MLLLVSLETQASVDHIPGHERRLAGGLTPFASSRKRPGAAAQARQASFVIAMIMPISTNTTIAACIQIQVGDIATSAYFAATDAGLRRGP
jgi:hypothetical protein